jgi:hypothetical protein
MINWLQLNDEQRKTSVDQVSLKTGITAKAIEKDWWVTLNLKVIFESAFAKYLVFKGGTSLSKCWKLIERFSEDIDIALDPEAFGMKYIENPTKGHVERLRRKGCQFTSTELKVELEKQFAALGIAAGIVTIEAEPIPEKFPDTDPQTLHVKYRSLYDVNDYIADEVKIEVSIRSLKTPFTIKTVQSILCEVTPNTVYAETPFIVYVAEARKTFLEKVFLLHEEFLKTNKASIRTERMSRHLYDLGNMADTAIEASALSDRSLYNTIVKHREWYSRISWVNYDTLNPATISFIPTDEVIEIYRKDYQTMQEQMIYGEALDFDSLIGKLRRLQEKIRLLV